MAAATRQDMARMARSGERPDADDRTFSRSGNTVSFPEVYTEQAPFVWRLLRRLGVDAHALEDAMQEVFLVVVRRLADYEGRSSLRTWVYGITSLVARDFRRRRRRHDLRTTALDPESVPSVAHGSPLESAEHAEQLAVLYRALEALAPEQRDVLVLVELEQMSVPVVAQILGVNLSTMYSRLRSARKAFAEVTAGYRRAREGEQ